MATSEIQELKTIKIPEEEWKKLEEVRKLLITNGINSLEGQIRKDAERQIDNNKNLTWGIIIGIGATLLTQALTEQ
ncbi:MAG: hypothetical protein V1886_02575 [archaeon]